MRALQVAIHSAHRILVKVQSITSISFIKNLLYFPSVPKTQADHPSSLACKRGSRAQLGKLSRERRDSLRETVSYLGSRKQQQRVKARVPNLNNE